MRFDNPQQLNWFRGTFYIDKESDKLPKVFSMLIKKHILYVLYNIISRLHFIHVSKKQCGRPDLNEIVECNEVKVLEFFWNESKRLGWHKIYILYFASWHLPTFSFLSLFSPIRVRIYFSFFTSLSIFYGTSNSYSSAK